MYDITVVGTGYVGLVSGTCFAETGNRVTCVDIDEEKIAKLNQGIIPIYEPGLKELVDKNKEEESLSFTTNLEKSIKGAEVIIIAVGTPSNEEGECDLTFVKNVAEQIGKYINSYKVIVNKSTVPVGTGRMVESIISAVSENKYEFDVVSNPEFLREGSAVFDTFNMERAVIGATSEKAADIIEEIHVPFDTRILRTNLETAEMIKYASNAFLATKISFINEIANICEKVGADVTEVARGMGMDSRIGDKFLNAGIGYGGSCFPKDTRALIKTAEKADCELSIVKAAEEINKLQRLKVVGKLEKELGDLKGKQIGILGLSFKPNTDDMREAPSLTIVPVLLEKGAFVKVYDPVAIEEAKKDLGDSITYCSSLEEAVKDVNAVVLLTEWDEFKEMDMEKAGSLVRDKVFVDGRNVFDIEKMEEMGWIYKSMGR